MKTIAFIFTTFPPEISGSAQYNWERVQWFARQSTYRVVVFAPDCQNSAPLPQVSNDLRQRLSIDYYPSIPWLPYDLHYAPTSAAVRQIEAKLPEYQPDLIVVVDIDRFFLLSTWHFPGQSYAKTKQIPYITEYHTDYYNFSTTYAGWKWLRPFLLNPLTSYIYRQFDLTLAPSLAAAASLQAMGIPNVHTTHFYGIDLSSYHPSRNQRQCLETWLTPEEKDNRVILYLGRLSPEKRVDLLVQAFKNLKQQGKNNSLLIVGDGPTDTVRQLQRLARNIPHLHFTGFIEGDRKADILASCDLFCNPCPYETFGRTVPEAMASGVPVVTVNSGAVAEYIVDGVNGYLVKPNHLGSLTQTLDRALSTDNSQLIINALQDKERFSVDRGCQNLSNYYQQILQGDRQLAISG
jgi:phosphatidylinositol alpha 1,6-mannosyltransferase